MTFTNAVKKDRIFFHELNTFSDTMAEDVHAGLSRKRKSLPPKLFYDQRGSKLFDAITRSPEYYLTRTEIRLLREHAREMGEWLGEDSILLELGSGSSAKIRLLLEAVQPRIYAPIDISRRHLIDAAQRIAADYPWLTVHAVCVDFSGPWEAPVFGPGRRNVFFPGSSIGNFDRVAARGLLARVANLVGRGGGLLIGVDLKKETELLEAAYNDAAGVTAEFNLNILAHINHRMGADFNVAQFAHKAIYNESEGRIEMYLTSKSNQSVRIEDRTYSLAAGEEICTEHSYKYSVAEFQRLAMEADFAPRCVWTDAKNWFSIHYLTVDEA